MKATLPTNVACWVVARKSAVTAESPLIVVRRGVELFIPFWDKKARAAASGVDCVVSDT